MTGICSEYESWFDCFQSFLPSFRRRGRAGGGGERGTPTPKLPLHSRTFSTGLLWIITMVEWTEREGRSGSGLLLFTLNSARILTSQVEEGGGSGKEAE